MTVRILILATLVLGGCTTSELLTYEYDPEATVKSGLILRASPATQSSIDQERQLFGDAMASDVPVTVPYRQTYDDAGLAAPHELPESFRVSGIHYVGTVASAPRQADGLTRYEVLTGADDLVIVYNLHGGMSVEECVTLAVSDKDHRYPVGMFHGGDCSGLVFPCISAGVVVAPRDGPADFRIARWGMNCAEVKALESSPLLREEQETREQRTLLYKDRLAGLNVIAAYHFVNNALIGAEYRLVEEHAEANSHIRDFNTLKALLTRKHGAPKFDDQLWASKQDLFTRTLQDWGLAISHGLVTYVARWETDTTTIELKLRGTDGEPRQQITYASRTLQHRQRIGEEREEIKKL